MGERRAELSALVLTRDAGRGLPRLLAQLAAVAGEIVVGVDTAASEETFETARRSADVVFRFEHVGPPVRVRLPALRFASGDWILSVDEDELLDESLAALLPELVGSRRFDHYWFPRRWVVAEEPAEYLHGPPWFPDWQLRLFRNDPTRVWHPGVVHAGYRVVGRGAREERGTLLHYERLTRSDTERAAQVVAYRENGSAGAMEDFYGLAAVERRRLESPPAAAAESNGRGPARVVPAVLAVPERPLHPPWGARIEVEMPSRTTCGGAVTAEVVAHNTGGLRWSPPGPEWPRLSLSYHLHSARPELRRWDGPRFPVPREVRPGKRVRFLPTIAAPHEPGEYELQWDLVSDGDCWFRDCGSETASVRLTVSRPTGARETAPR